MNALDYILLALLVVAGHRAIGYIIKKKDKGCCGDCTKCSSSCGSCESDSGKEE